MLVQFQLNLAWSCVIDFCRGLYVGCLSFAVVRIITALFLRQVLAVATKDEQMLRNQQVLKQRKYSEDIRSLYADHADPVGQGCITHEQFEEFLTVAKKFYFFVQSFILILAWWDVHYHQGHHDCASEAEHFELRMLCVHRNSLLRAGVMRSSKVIYNLLLFVFKYTAENSSWVPQLELLFFFNKIF